MAPLALGAYMTPEQQANILTDVGLVARMLGLAPAPIARVYREDSWTDPETGEVHEGGWVVEVRHGRQPAFKVAKFDCESWVSSKQAWLDLVAAELDGWRDAACGEPCDRVEVGGAKISGCKCVGDKAIAFSPALGNVVPYKGEPPRVFISAQDAARPAPIDWGNLKRAPTTRPFIYAPITIDKAALKAAKKEGAAFREMVRADVDRAIKGLYDQRDAMIKSAFEAQGLPPSVLGTTAGRHRAVLHLAQIGAVTAEQARELLEMPAVDARLPCQHKFARGYTEYPKRVDGTRYCTACGAVMSTPDPLDVEYDGVMLRALLDRDAAARQESDDAQCGFCSLPLAEHRLKRGRDCERFRPRAMTPVQRTAVSAYWSAELRARVEASKERDRQRVVLDQEID